MAAPPLFSTYREQISTLASDLAQLTRRNESPAVHDTQGRTQGLSDRQHRLAVRPLGLTVRKPAYGGVGEVCILSDLFVGLTPTMTEKNFTPQVRHDRLSDIGIRPRRHPSTPLEERTPSDQPSPPCSSGRA